MSPAQKEPTDGATETAKRLAIVRENPFDSLRATITSDVADWSADRRMAWIYGIVCGWDKEAMAELAQKFNWPPHETERLKRLHEKFVSQAQQTVSVLFQLPPTQASVLAKVKAAGEFAIYERMFEPAERPFLTELINSGQIQRIERAFKGGPAYRSLTFGFFDEVGDTP